MSFSKDIKTLICDTLPKSSCCRRAMLFGVLTARGKAVCEKTEIKLDSVFSCVAVSNLIKEFFQVLPKTETPRGGGRAKNVSFFAKAPISYLTSLDNGDKIDIKEKCSSCRGAALRGIFLASGRMSDPEKQFCLEFSPLNRTKALLNYFDGLGLEFRSAHRNTKGGYDTVYAKKASAIEDFFGMAGLGKVTYDVINTAISKSINNRTNRLTNVEMVNIEKTVNAASEQIEIISRLIETGLIEKLPEELIHTANERVRYSDYSLASLARNHTPPLTKSGLNHRLKRIMELGRELLENKNKD